MTVWMDFNPFIYTGIELSILVGDDVAFDFNWDWYAFGVVVQLVMKFGGSSQVFVLYEQFNRAEVYPSAEEDDV